MGTSPLHSPWWNYPNNHAPRALPLSTQHLLIVHHCTVGEFRLFCPMGVTWPPGKSRVGLIGTFLLFWVTMSSDFWFSQQNRCLLCATIEWWVSYGVYSPLVEGACAPGHCYVWALAAALLVLVQDQLVVIWEDFLRIETEINLDCPSPCLAFPIPTIYLEAQQLTCLGVLPGGVVWLEHHGHHLGPGLGGTAGRGTAALPAAALQKTRLESL